MTPEQKIKRALRSLILSVKAHPDYTGEENAEWTDLIETAEDALASYAEQAPPDTGDRNPYNLDWPKQYPIMSNVQDRTGISIEWQMVWSEVESWYGDPQKKETGEQFLKRLQSLFALTQIGGQVTGKIAAESGEAGKLPEQQPATGQQKYEEVQAINKKYAIATLFNTPIEIDADGRHSFLTTTLEDDIFLLTGVFPPDMVAEAFGDFAFVGINQSGIWNIEVLLVYHEGDPDSGESSYLNIEYSKSEFLCSLAETGE